MTIHLKTWMIQKANDVIDASIDKVSTDSQTANDLKTLTHEAVPNLVGGSLNKVSHVANVHQKNHKHIKSPAHNDNSFEGEAHNAANQKKRTLPSQAMAKLTSDFDKAETAKNERKTHSQVYREEYKNNNSKEKIEPHTSYERARNAALEMVGEIDSTNRYPHEGRLGMGKGKLTSFTTEHEGKKKTYRMDYDDNKGPHINVEIDDGKKREKTAFTFPGTKEEAQTITNNIDKTVRKGLDKQATKELNNAKK